MTTATRHHALVAVCAAACLAGCGTGGSGSGGGGLRGGPGVDPATRTITVGIESPLTGPVGVIGKPLTEGQEAYFDHVNDHGGIDGWRIRFLERDDRYDPQAHVQYFDELLPDIAMLAQSLGSPTTAAIEQQAAAAHLVVGAAAQSSAFVNDPVMAVIGTPYAIDVANGIDYVVNQLGHHDARIAIFYQNDDYGADGIKGYDAAKAQYRFNDVARVPYALTDSDFTGPAQQLQASRADYVVVTAIPSAAAKLVATAASLGYHPHWIFQSSAWSEYLMTSDGTASGAPTPLYPLLTGHASGSVWVLGYEAPWGDTSAPGMSRLLSDHDRYFPAQPPDVYFTYGYCEAVMEVAVLRKAIESNNLSRQGILDAKLHLGSVDFGGLMPRLTYTPALGPADRETDLTAIDPSRPGFLRILRAYFESAAARTLRF